MSVVWLLRGWELSDVLATNRYENFDYIADKGCSGICALYECSELQSLSPHLSVIDRCFLQVSGVSRWNRYPHKENFPPDTIYGLSTAVLTNDDTLMRYRNQLWPLQMFLITETDEDSLTRELWNSCCKLLWNNTISDKQRDTTTCDLVLIDLNIQNQVILQVANVVTGMLLSIPDEIPFLCLLGFDPNWKRSFEDLLPYRNEGVPFLPRQSFQSVDEYVLERHCFDHSTHLWTSFYKDGFTRRDNCCRFIPQQCLSLGCNRVILAEHLVYEIAFLLEKVPKYGS